MFLLRAIGSRKRYSQQGADQNDVIRRDSKDPISPQRPANTTLLIIKHPRGDGAVCKKALRTWSRQHKRLIWAPPNSWSAAQWIVTQYRVLCGQFLSGGLGDKPSNTNDIQRAIGRIKNYAISTSRRTKKLFFENRLYFWHPVAEIVIVHSEPIKIDTIERGTAILKSTQRPANTTLTITKFPPEHTAVWKCTILRSMDGIEAKD